MKKNKILILLIGIVLLGSVLRLYKLGSVPNGLYQDETAIGYNAYSILKTGHDEHGQKFPLYFRSFGDFKLPLYIYTDVIPVAIFGLTDFTPRLPSAFFGILTIPLLYAVTLSLSKSKKLALVSAGILAFNPWHIHYSRATFEVSIGLFLYLLALLFFLKAVQGKKKYYFILSVFVFLLSLYTYNLTRLLSPLLMGMLIVIYRRQMHVIEKNEKYLSVGLFAILLLPFVLTFFSAGGYASASGTLITSSPVVRAEFIEMKSYLATFSPLIVKPFFNIFVLVGLKFFQNIASYISAPFFFISGSTHGNHGIGTVGQFYLLDLGFLAIGIVSLLKKYQAWATVLFGWVLAVVLVASLTREAPHATRSYFLIFPLTVLIGYGMINVYTTIMKASRRWLRLVLFIVIAGIMIVGIVQYIVSYFVRFPVEYASAWRSEEKSVAHFIADNPRYEKVIFDRDAGYMYTSLLYFTAYDPIEFQKTAAWSPPTLEGFSFPLNFGKYEFRAVDWQSDLLLPHTLIVTTAEKKPNEVPAIKTFSYPTRPAVVVLDGAIQQFPIEDSAYVLVETK